MCGAVLPKFILGDLVHMHHLSEVQSAEQASLRVGFFSHRQNIRGDTMFSESRKIFSSDRKHVPLDQVFRRAPASQLSADLHPLPVLRYINNGDNISALH